MKRILLVGLYGILLALFIVKEWALPFFLTVCSYPILIAILVDAPFETDEQKITRLTKGLRDTMDDIREKTLTVSELREQIKALQSKLE